MTNTFPITSIKNHREEEVMPGTIENQVPRLLREKGFTDPKEAMKELMWGARLTAPTAQEWASEGNTPKSVYMDTLVKICDFFGVGVGDILKFIPN